MKILVVEDTKDLNKAVCTALSLEAYAVDSAFDGEEALSCMKEESYDCVVMDIMMPRLDGLGVLKIMRENHNTTPVLLLTAKSEIEDRVEGLDAGADDYLPKPFSFQELTARIRALTRRAESSWNDISYGDIRLDGSTLAMSKESTVRLSSLEFSLMRTLISHEEALSEEYLLRHVFADEKTYENTVLLYVSYLKKKLNAIRSDVLIEESADGWKISYEGDLS